MRLHRSALFAGLLALGVSACGDDVQIVESPPTPPPALNATLAPNSASVLVGGNADYGVGISGGETGVTATWTCTSANTGVASVAQTATGCRATGVAAGTTSINVVVTKGEQTANASAGVTVSAVSTTPARLTIANVDWTNPATGVVGPVPINAVQGQIDVTLNLTRNTETPTRVELLLGGVVVATQNMTAQAPAEVDGAQAVEPITLSFNTAAYTFNAAAGTATVAHANGPRVLSARVIVGATTRAADNTVTLTLTNPDVIHIASLVLPSNSALSAGGQIWYGGPGSGSIGFTAIPVMYSGRTASTVGLAGAFGAGCAAPAVDAAAPYTFSSPCATSTAAVNPVAGGFASQATDGNAIVFGAAVGAGFAVAPVAVGTNPFPIFVDNVAPAGAALVFASQASIANRENWGTGAYSLTTGYTAPADAGIGLPAGGGAPAFAEADFQVRTGTTAVAGHTFAEDVRTLAGLDNSVNNTTYNAQVRVGDRLGNVATVTMAANAGHAVTAAAATSHPLATFGVDKDSPVATRGAVGAGAITTATFTVDAAAANYEVQATDVLSGFALPVTGGGPGEALRHVHVSVLGTANSSVLTTAGLAGTGAVSTTPFATANAGTFLRTPANYVDGYVQGPTSITSNASTSGSVVVPAAARYYIYQAQARDKAGNLSNILGWQVYRNAGSFPAITGLVIGGLLTGGAPATFPAVAQDVVEVSEGSFDLTYGAAGVLGNAAGDRIVWERPSPMASTLFDDAIAIPNSFSLVAPQFIRGLQGVNVGPAPFAPVAGPSIANLITARAYNGMATSLTTGAVSHADATAGVANGPTGASAYAAAAILPGQVQPGTAFVAGGATGINNFQIVSYGATSSGTTRTITLLVRATGASGTFVNPFAGGGLRLYQRRAAGNANPAAATAGDAFLRPVTATVTPLFVPPFPTLDNGVQRDYDWSVVFTVSTATPFVNLHVVGLSTGFDALGTRETQIVGANAAAGTAPGTIF